MMETFALIIIGLCGFFLLIVIMVSFISWETQRRYPDPQRGDLWIHKENSSLIKIVEAESPWVNFYYISSDDYPEKIYTTYTCKIRQLKKTFRKV